MSTGPRDILSLCGALSLPRWSVERREPDYRTDLKACAVPALESLLAAEKDERVFLEAAGSAATLSSDIGTKKVQAVLWEGEHADLLDVRLPIAAIKDIVPPAPPLDPKAPGPFSFGDQGRYSNGGWLHRCRYRAIRCLHPVRQREDAGCRDRRRDGDDTQDRRCRARSLISPTTSAPAPRPRFVPPLRAARRAVGDDRRRGVDRHGAQSGKLTGI
jgi:hypothetical protein